MRSLFLVAMFSILVYGGPATTVRAEARIPNVPVPSDTLACTLSEIHACYRGDHNRCCPDKGRGAVVADGARSQVERSPWTVVKVLFRDPTR